MTRGRDGRAAGTDDVGGSRGPDNAAGWDALADAYQTWVGWPEDELAWGLACPPESELGLVSDVVVGARTLVLGCGGGQDLVAVARLGAGPLTGVDPSERQLAHARRRLEAAHLDARLLAAVADQLDEVETASIDLVVSVQACNYLPDPVAAFREVRRVLRPGGHLAFSVLHPADVSTDDDAPYGWHTSWFEVERDWEWDGLADTAVPFRSWFPSASGWFTAVTAAGLQVERLLEPPAVDPSPWIERGWLAESARRKLLHVPATILVRARRGADNEDHTLPR